MKTKLEDIVTRDREEFLIYEMKFFGKRSLKKFKEIMKDMDTACDKCGIYYWKDCLKRCNCDES